MFGEGEPISSDYSHDGLDSEEKVEIMKQQNAASSIEAILVEKPPKECVCPICLTLALDPVVFSPCGHLFCRSCDSRIYKCSICLHPRAGTSANALDVKSTIEKLKVYCSRKRCSTIIEVKNVEAHKKTCRFGNDVCAYCGGGFVRFEWDQPKAHNEHCPVGRILNKELRTKERLENVKKRNRALKEELDRLSEENMRWRNRCKISNRLLSKDREKAKLEARKENMMSIKEALGIRFRDDGERKEIADYMKMNPRLEKPGQTGLDKLESVIV